MSSEPQSHPQTRDQIDKRVPPEIWHRIFNRLYPSQLSQVSMVSNNFNKLVSSMSVWSRMFSITFGPTKRLRTLSSMPESKSYMLYMCASSLRICEECLRLLAYDVDAQMLQPILAPMPTMTNGNIQYLGEEVNIRWRVWMCSSCRQKQVSIIEGGSDRKTKERIQWYREQD